MSEQDWGLDGIDFDHTLGVVAEKQAEEESRPATEAGDGCEDGACKI